MQTIAASQAYGHVGLTGKLVHVRLSQLAHLKVGNVGVTKCQYTGAELVLFQLGVITEVTQLGQGVGHARNGGFRQPGQARDVLIAQNHRALAKGPKHIQATGKCLYKFAIFLRLYRFTITGCCQEFRRGGLCFCHKGASSNSCA